MDALRAYLRNTDTVIHGNNTIVNIRHVLEGAFPDAVSQTKVFSESFKGPTNRDTACNVWRYVRSNIQYETDPIGLQDIRLPARLLADKKGDCKSFALFSAAVLYNLGFVVCFRYAGYFGNEPTHVYITASKGGNTFIVDPVWDWFDSEKLPATYKKDKCMSVRRLEGIGAVATREPSLLDANVLYIGKQLGVDKMPAGERAMVMYKIKTGLMQRMAGQEVNLSGCNPPSLIEKMSGVLGGVLGTLPGDFKDGCEELYCHVSGVLSAVVAPAKPVDYDSILKQLEAAEISGVLGKHGEKLKNFFHKLDKGLLKVFLGAGRGAFLVAADLNFRKVAWNLDKKNIDDPKGLQKWWEGIGGNYARLVKSINKGKNKKNLQLFGKNRGDNYGAGRGAKVSGVLSGPELAAIASAAAPVIVLFVKLIGGKSVHAKNPDGTYKVDTALDATEEGLSTFATEASNLDPSNSGIYNSIAQTGSSLVDSTEDELDASFQTHLHTVAAKDKNLGGGFSKMLLPIGAIAVAGGIYLATKKS